MFTNLMYMDTAKSPKSPKNCNGSFSNNVGPPKKVHDFIDIKHQGTSLPFKNIDITQDDKTVGTNSSQESNQLEKECKMMSNLLKRADSDNIDLNSQDEKLILKIANKNIKQSLPSDITKLKTQEFMELNLGLATQNLQPSCMQLGTFKEMVDSEDVTVVTASTSNKLQDSKQNKKNEDIYEKTNDSKCLIDYDQESKSLKETPNSKSSKQDEDLEAIIFQPLTANFIKMNSIVNSLKIGVMSDDFIKPKQVNTTVKRTRTKQSANGTTHSKKLNNSKSLMDYVQKFESLKKTQNSKSSKHDEDLNSIIFQSLKESFLNVKSKSDSLMESVLSDDFIKPKQVNTAVKRTRTKQSANGTTLSKKLNDSIYSTDYVQKSKSLIKTPNSKSSKQDGDLNTIIFQSLNENFINMKSKLDSLMKSVLSDDFIKPKQVNTAVKRTSTKQSANGTTHSKQLNDSKSPQIGDVGQNKNSKLNSNSILYKPVLNKVECSALTPSKDEDNRAIINNEFPKVQNAMTVSTRKQLFGSTKKATKRLKKVKPILTCVPNEQICKDMVNSSRGTLNFHRKLNSNSVLNNPDLNMVSDSATTSDDGDC